MCVFKYVNIGMNSINVVCSLHEFVSIFYMLCVLQRTDDDASIHDQVLW